LNICRHRAYPVIEKGSGEGGKVSILACKYHGECRCRPETGP
jgi:phenylpropionate dioxygenase-like ring-hydroxylating dioxygenase large terminal subunit